jgi:hypothetical protein
VLVSEDANFKRISGVADAYIPAVDLWLGEYPYVSKVSLQLLFPDASKYTMLMYTRKAATSVSNTSDAC